MTDRIRSEFELFAHKHELNTASTGGRYNAPVVRWMWEAWKHQAEHITDMAAALERAHNRQTGLLNQCRDIDARQAVAVAHAASLAAEIERLNLIISRLYAEGQDAVEM